MKMENRKEEADKMNDLRNTTSQISVMEVKMNMVQINRVT